MSEVVSNKNALREWVHAVATHTRPERIHWCDGSEVERYSLERELVAAGTMRELDLELHPRSFRYGASGSVVGERTESLIATRNAEDAGPTNDWINSEVARDVVWPLFAGSMVGRTMYVVPYLLGPARSEFSRVGVEITDSPYAVLGLRTMTRIGRVALEHLDYCGPFVRALHSVGRRHPERRFLVHWPQEQQVWCFGSDAARHSVANISSHSLRLAGYQGFRQGWLAESMALFGVRNPSGQTRFVAAALPRGCGKTELTMLAPTLPGWSIDVLGDSVCWMRPGRDGRLWAVNPQLGMYGEAYGARSSRNANVRAALSRDVLYESAHPDIDLDPTDRFIAPMPRRLGARDTVDGSRGVPLSAILFGTRRSDFGPLVYETRSWEHGVYVGATLASESIDPRKDGVVQNDPMTVLGSCVYDMGAYLGHWLSLGRELTRAPKIFHVNWFRTDHAGRLLWPGFGENIRVLKWVLERVEGVASRLETPIGFVPGEGALDVSGLSLADDALLALRFVDCAAWHAEVERTRRLFARLERTLPNELRKQHAELLSRLATFAN